MPISVVRGERAPGRKWTFKDRVIALSLTQYEAGLCGGCGQPLDLTTGEHARDYEVETITCTGCRELDDFDKKLEPGQKLIVRLDDDPNLER